MIMVMLSLLQHVIDHGAPAQAARAREIAAALTRDPDSAELRRAARELIDAFLHDPYLTR
jgi:hypothetical protein